MKTEIQYQPAFATCTVSLDNGEQLRAESGAMVAMRDVKVETGATGGLFKSLKRSILGGESFFQNTFTATSNNGQVMLAPALTGDVMVREMKDEDLIVQSGAYLGSSMGINVDTSWGGARTFFGGEGLFMLRCSGTGTLITGAYGAIHEENLRDGETFVVDSGHIVAFQAGMHYEVNKFGGWKSTVLGGEGLVITFAGPGQLYMQTRSQEAFLGWLIPQLPTRSGETN
ncbi:MAG: TIGR00266 family protein [Thermomicrobiales bacterium]|nr:TIGR00266 family protein [Thermomicrobiales bacterium]MCO5221840.1 TIGR00266 family protein [Thermomicrobiales bacterium]